MEFLWFLLGLAIGLLFFVWYRYQLARDLKRLTQNLDAASVSVGASLTSQLTLAIAQQQRSNQQFSRHLEILKQVINLAPISYLQVDEENQLTWCNPLACQTLDIQRCDSDQPRLLLELVRSYELDSLIEQARDQQKLCQRDWTFYIASAEAVNMSEQRAIPLRGTAFPLLDGAVGVFLENRQEAVTLVQQRDRWASDVAHELKTPLTSIRLVAETLQSRLDPPTRNWVDRLLKESVRLSTLVQELLDLSQLDVSPTQRLSLKTVDLVKLIHAAWLTLEPLSSAKSLQLDYQGLDRLLIRVDESRLHRVFLNLLDNAIRYSPPQRSLQVRLSLHPVTRLSTKQATQEIQIDVIDGGQGFPESSLPFVFDRFYRADPSRSRSGSEHPSHSQANSDVALQPVQFSSGSGLGLAIVRQIVEAHQGIVSAKNDPQTGGAWLQILLPWSEQIE
ncbi:MAG: PAS domain-containing sensor histidine kinase [Leptolyngbyaceae cyanobacterium CSU_1_3]|nr:PAS domain-containing sensor histidine kinase [Leptolyngbyaceae cyanobacterium CSU_1_3]